jgi:hypothetical protein
VLGNRYVVEHTLVGRKVLVRVRESDRQLRVFDDDRLVVEYVIPEGKGHLVQEERFYAALKADRELQARKFGHGNAGKLGVHKGRAVKKTVGPTKPAHPIDIKLIDVGSIQVEPIDVVSDVRVDVEQRSLCDYSALSGEVLCA